MRFALVILAYAIIGGCVYTWAVFNETINPLIPFGFFITYSILGGILFVKLDKRGVIF